MRIYAIVKRRALPELKDWFHPQHGHHYVDLDADTVLLLGHFSKPSGENLFGTHPDVELLPDLEYSGNEPLKPEHQTRVAHLKPAGNTIVHLARAAGKQNPLMKLRSWE